MPRRAVALHPWTLSLLLCSVTSVAGVSFRAAKAPAPAILAQPPGVAVAPSPVAPHRLPPPVPHVQDPPPPPLAPPVRPGLPPAAPLEGSKILPLPGALTAAVPTILPDVYVPPQAPPSLGTLSNAPSPTAQAPVVPGGGPPPDLPEDVEPLAEDVVREALPSELAPPMKPADPMPLPQAPQLASTEEDAIEAAAAADGTASPTAPGVRSLTHPMAEQLQGGGGIVSEGQLLAQPFALSMPQTLSASGFAIPASPPLESDFPTEAPPSAEVGTVAGDASVAHADGTPIDTSAPMPQQKCSCCPGCAQAPAPAAPFFAAGLAGAPASVFPLAPGFPLAPAR